MMTRIALLAVLLSCSCDGLQPLETLEDAGADALPVDGVPCTDPIVLKRAGGPCNYTLPSGVSCALVLYLDGSQLPDASYMLNCGAATVTFTQNDCPDVPELWACSAD